MLPPPLLVPQEGGGKGISPSDSFRINAKFTDRMRRIRVGAAGSRVLGGWRWAQGAGWYGEDLGAKQCMALSSHSFRLCRTPPLCAHPCGTCCALLHPDFLSRSLRVCLWL